LPPAHGGQFSGARQGKQIPIRFPCSKESRNRRCGSGIWRTARLIRVSRASVRALRDTGSGVIPRKPRRNSVSRTFWATALRIGAGCG
jgi:hypothetical protein